MTNEVKLKKPIWKKWWFWLIAVFVIIIIVIRVTSEEIPTRQSQIAKYEAQMLQQLKSDPEKMERLRKTIESQKEVQEKSQVETTSNAFKLASLEIGHNNPPKSLIKAFDDLLGKLKKKCPQDNEVKIANYIFKGQKWVKEEGGGTVKLLDFGNALNESIPEEMAGVVNCAEISAALVVLITTE